ncbi:sigma-54 dependent transcriptional regulator [bacterium]|nr:sigma-54 dependent transcriptional regulator [bacterium]
MSVTLHKILVVDDEPEICWIMKKILVEKGYEVQTAFNGEQGLEMAEALNPDLVFLDLRLPGMDGLEVLERLKKKIASLPVVILSAFENINAAVRAMKLGAYDYISKPLNVDEMLITLKNALKTKQLMNEVKQLKNQISNKNRHYFIWNCPAMQKVMTMVNKISQYDVTVLVLGASGTGKELIAEYIHKNSPRKDKPMISIDCSALPENLVESELFGYEKGAFTGANEAKPGRFELANGGTLLLDEIGNLPVSTQIKLLRVLQERKLQRLGGKSEIEIDVRVITATNVDLKKSMLQGTFREDLYHRINEFSIIIPPLIERKEDIELLVRHFIDRFSRQFDKPVPVMTPETLTFLQQYTWPGNIRELMNAIKRAVVMAGDTITLEYFPKEHFENKVVEKPTEPEAICGRGLPIRPLKEVCQEVSRRVEKETISRVLQETRWNKVKTARMLKINYKTLFNKMRELGI